MKKFKFRYEQLLKIRTKKMDDLKHEMGELNHRLNLLEEEKQGKLAAQAAYFQEINERVSKGCSSQELMRLNYQKSYYSETLLRLEGNIREVNLLIMQKREQLNEAIKEQKIMEKLKEKEYERYLQAIDAAEVKVTEEIVNYNNYKGRED
ncbi:MAG: flagellar FliJ family protein [Clostridia bacterium]|nr:flagellar FliJ family protein [Clostridia bacterium]